MVFCPPRPLRHLGVVRRLAGGSALPTPIPGTDGIIEEFDRFLNRRQAAAHAKKCSQIRELK
jgi:hypothetical protein